MSSSIVKFQPLKSAIGATFWHELYEAKIDKFKLDDNTKTITAYYLTGKNNICLDSINPTDLIQKVNKYIFPINGILKNTNTLEEFIKLDKIKELNDVAEMIWSDIITGNAVKDPSLLNRFILITYANLKKYTFNYLCGFPVLVPTFPFKAISVNNIAEIFNQEQIKNLYTKFDEFRTANIKSNFNGYEFFLIDYDDIGISIGNLTEWNNFHKNNEIRVGFVDTSMLQINPGWTLRNFLVLLRKYWKVNTVKVFCYREIIGKNDISNTVVIDIDLSQTDFSYPSCPKSVGWEKDQYGKLTSIKIDLAPLMDPLQLASIAVDLNLKLMKWRLNPTLDLDKISNTKCLLFGAGTLGCNVARCLLGWGVRNITFVDNATISFSNPVRQSLYLYEDCLNNGKSKAIVAAETLKKIFPAVNTLGYNIHIPMPGHSISLVEQTKKDIELIEQLIISHDVIFLLLDSREGRWLPSMLGATHKKIIINAALGYETYLVMRHGVRNNENITNLGCYFCNDVVAPRDSMKNSTLDQQCTVARPGISYIAGALAVELLVSILQHPLGSFAPCQTNNNNSIPHQIRGSITDYVNNIVIGSSYDKCTTCSDKILNEYKKCGFNFLLEVFNNPFYLEELTGLSNIHNEMNIVIEQWGTEDDF